MKKLITILFFTLYMGASHALIIDGLTLGVSGSVTNIEASGTETEGGETNSINSVDNERVLIPSLFIEYDLPIFNGISIGLDYIPVDADVSDKAMVRKDTETSVTGTATTTTTARTQSAQAELTDHYTLYADVMFTESFYVKGGFVQVDLNTLESLGTGSAYGNKTVNGMLAGFGFKTDSVIGKYMKLEAVWTDYDDISISSTVARTGVTTNNKIDADLDTTAIKIAFGF